VKRLRGAWNHAPLIRCSTGIEKTGRGTPSPGPVVVRDYSDRRKFSKSRFWLLESESSFLQPGWLQSSRRPSTPPQGNATPSFSFGPAKPPPLFVQIIARSGMYPPLRAIFSLQLCTRDPSLTRSRLQWPVPVFVVSVFLYLPQPSRYSIERAKTEAPISRRVANAKKATIRSSLNSKFESRPSKKKLLASRRIGVILPPRP
jgi:hypothetical protein